MSRFSRWLHGPCPWCGKSLGTHSRWKLKQCAREPVELADTAIIGAAMIGLMYKALMRPDAFRRDIEELSRAYTESVRALLPPPK